MAGELMSQAIIVIPARYAASRFPGKLLAPLQDKPVIQWVWEGARSAKLADRVIVATDDERIAAAVNGFGGEVVMSSPEIRSLREPIETVGDLFDPNIVKVVASLSGDALYFSRAPIPYFRTEGNLHADFRSVLFGRERPVEGYYRHVGVYAFRRSSLLEFASTAPTPLEKAEGLEQLRLLQTGRRLRLLDSDFRSVGIDTLPDLRRALLVLEGRQRGA